MGLASPAAGSNACAKTKAGSVLWSATHLLVATCGAGGLGYRPEPWSVSSNALLSRDRGYVQSFDAGPISGRFHAPTGLSAQIGRAPHVGDSKGGRHRDVGMDAWGWEQFQPWLTARAKLPVGPLFCIIDGPTRGRPWSGAAVRAEFRRLAQAPLRAAPAAPTGARSQGFAIP